MRKPNSVYYFTVEGETEKSYLEWLQHAINDYPNSLKTVRFNVKVEKDPLSGAKRMSIIDKTIITHICDIESNEECHSRNFQRTMDQMKKAEKLGKNIKYYLGYSNFTFELWLILHKDDCNDPLTHRDQYLKKINQAFGEKFDRLDKFKQKDNFVRVLNSFSIEDVKHAIQRARQVTKNNNTVGYQLQSYKNYNYYMENPSLSVWETIEKIFKDCGLLN